MPSEYDDILERAMRRRCGDPYVTIPRNPEIITRPPIWWHLWTAITWPFRAIIWGLLTMISEWGAVLWDVVRKNKKRPLEEGEAFGFACLWLIALGLLVQLLPIWGH